MKLLSKSLFLIFTTFVLIGCVNDITKKERVITIIINNQYKYKIEDVKVSFFGNVYFFDDINPGESKNYTIDLKKFKGETSIIMSYLMNKNYKTYRIVGYTDGSHYGEAYIKFNEKGEIEHKGLH